MPRHRLPLRPLQQHDQRLQEQRMPLILMGLQQIVRLLKREQVRHEAAHRRALADALAQDPGVRRGRHGVGGLGEVADAVAHVVAQRLDAQPVRERVQVQQHEVRGLAPGVGRVVRERARVEPLREVFEGGERLFGEADGLRVGFDEGPAEGGGEEGGAGGEEVFVEEEFGAGGADDDGGEGLVGFELGAKGEGLGFAGGGGAAGLAGFGASCSAPGYGRCGA
ncbi:MAG: hypothetical protein Q9165_002355 [Trypethelium subeluteriae]